MNSLPASGTAFIGPSDRARENWVFNVILYIRMCVGNFDGCGDPIMASITKGRPTFRDSREVMLANRYCSRLLMA